MGCASSSPIMDSGKNFVEGAKESVSDTISKGEKVLLDVGETAKEGLSSGIDTVKETMQSAVESAEHGVDTVMGKIGETFNFASSKDDLDAKKDELVTNASDAAAEAVSEAETVLASETESAKEAFASKASPVFETIQSTGEEMKEAVVENGIELIDDLEDVDHMLGDSVEEMERKVEETLKMSPDGSPVKELVKEEPSPTFWEAAADAILLQKTIKTLEYAMDYHREADNKKSFHHDINNEINEFITEANINTKREVIAD